MAGVGVGVGVGGQQGEPAPACSLAHLADSLIMLKGSHSRLVVILHAALPWLVNDARSLVALEGTCKLWRRLSKLADPQTWRCAYVLRFPGSLPVCAGARSSWKAAYRTRVDILRQHARTTAASSGVGAGAGAGAGATKSVQPVGSPRQKPTRPAVMCVLCHERAVHAMAYVVCVLRRGCEAERRHQVC